MRKQRINTVMYCPVTVNSFGIPVIAWLLMNAFDNHVNVVEIAALISFSGSAVKAS